VPSQSPPGRPGGCAQGIGEVSESMAGSEALLEGSQTGGSREAGYARARAFKDRS
jgi:hypothetical protein